MVLAPLVLIAFALIAAAVVLPLVGAARADGHA